MITGANAKSNVPEDHAEAVERYREAAEQGDAEAQSILGLMYFTGRGVLQDYVEAHMWLNLAASRFSAAETRNRDQAIRDRDHVAAKMTPAQVAEAQKLAREWKPKPGATANAADTPWAAQEDSGSERVSFDKIMRGTGQ